jgi:hypothetical protein
MRSTSIVATALRTASACLLAGLTTGCATMIHGTTQKVEITSNPSGASAHIEPVSMDLTTPATPTLSRANAYTVQFQLPGYLSKTENIDRESSGAVWGNLLLGGLIGMLVDSSNGAAYELVPEHLHVELEAVPTALVDAPVEALPLDEEPSAAPPAEDLHGP